MQYTTFFNLTGDGSMFRFNDSCAPYDMTAYGYEQLINDDEFNVWKGYYSVSDNAVYFLGDSIEDDEIEENLPDDFIKLPSLLFEVRPLERALFHNGLTLEEEALVASFPRKGFFSELKEYGLYPDYYDAHEMACKIVLRRFEQDHGIKLIAD